MGTTQIIAENGQIKVAKRLYDRAMGTNSAYCSTKIETIKKAQNLLVKKGPNSFNESKKKKSAQYFSSNQSIRKIATQATADAENNTNIVNFGHPARFVQNSLGKSNVDKNNIKPDYITYNKVSSTSNISSPEVVSLMTFPLNRISPFQRSLVKNKQKKSINIPPSLMNSLSKTYRTTGISTLQEMLSSFQIIPYTQDITLETETLIDDTPFATFSVYVTFLDGVFKLIINNFGNGFFYDNKVYRLDLSHYTNFGHTIKFNKDDSLSQDNDFSVVREGIPGTFGSFIQITTTNIENDVLYIYTELGGASSGSFYNPISILPNTELPVDYTTVTVTVEIVNNSGLKFVFDNTDNNILHSNRQFKFDVSNPTNAGYYLKFSKDSTSKVSYNTISIGTPGTENACVYFYSPNAVDVSSVYVYDEVKGYSVGDLYNPMTIITSPTYRTLNRQRELNGINFDLNEDNTLALITSIRNWQNINLEDNTTSSSSIDETQSLRNIYLDNSFTLISFLDNTNVYFVKKFYNTDLEYNNVIAECSNNSEYFGDSIVEFDNNYIISSYGNNSIHVFDLFLNFIKTITHEEGGEFGKKIASNNDFLFVSAPLHNNYQGTVYCYNKELSIVQTLTETDTVQFGLSTSVNALNMLVISSKNRVFEYIYDGTSFYYLDDLHPPETTQYDIPGTNIYENFGNQVLIDATGRYLYVSHSYLNYKSGAVYVYESIFNKRRQIQKIITDPPVNKSLFGDKIVVNDDYLVIFSNQEVVVYYDTYHIFTVSGDNSVFYDTSLNYTVYVTVKSEQEITLDLTNVNDLSLSSAYSFIDICNNYNQSYVSFTGTPTAINDGTFEFIITASSEVGKSNYYFNIEILDSFALIILGGTKQGDTLFLNTEDLDSDAIETIQWYRDNQLIDGATNVNTLVQADVNKYIWVKAGDLSSNSTVPIVNYIPTISASGDISFSHSIHPLEYEVTIYDPDVIFSLENGSIIITACGENYTNTGWIDVSVNHNKVIFSGTPSGQH